MPTQPIDPSTDEPTPVESHGDLDSPLSPADRDLLDEDGLLEDQPYATLEELPEMNGVNDGPEIEGAGSW